MSGKEAGKDSPGHRATSGRLAFSSSLQHSLSFLTFLSPDILQLRDSNPPLWVHRESLWFLSAGLAAPPPPPRSSSRPGGPTPARICTHQSGPESAAASGCGCNTPDVCEGVPVDLRLPLTCNAPLPTPRKILRTVPFKSLEKNLLDSSQASHSISRPISSFWRLPRRPSQPPHLIFPELGAVVFF